MWFIASKATTVEIIEHFQMTNLCHWLSSTFVGPCPQSINSVTLVGLCLKFLVGPVLTHVPSMINPANKLNEMKNISMLNWELRFLVGYVFVTDLLRESYLDQGLCLIRQLNLNLDLNILVDLKRGICPQLFYFHSVLFSLLDRCTWYPYSAWELASVPYRGPVPVTNVWSWRTGGSSFGCYVWSFPGRVKLLELYIWRWWIEGDVNRKVGTFTPMINIWFHDRHCFGFMAFSAFLWYHLAKWEAFSPSLKWS